MVTSGPLESSDGAPAAAVEASALQSSAALTAPESSGAITDMQSPVNGTSADFLTSTNFALSYDGDGSTETTPPPVPEEYAAKSDEGETIMLASSTEPTPPPYPEE